MAVKILVVDDEPDVGGMISQQYENTLAGYPVEFFFAYNGREALNLMEAQPIDVILTDLKMPVMDGLELLSHVNIRWPLVKVVVISAYNDIKNIRKAMNQGSFDFIIKPIEFEDLERTVGKAIKAAQDFRSIVSEKAIEHEKFMEIEKELEAARDIQSAFIPQNFQQLFEKTNFEIYGTMRPAKEVGGDFFDFFLVGQAQVGMVIGDVSGKGVPAALFMTMTRAALRCYSSQNIPAFLGQTNAFLCNRNESCMFVTLFYATLDTRTGELTCCNAGHNPPFIVSRDGSLQEIGRNQNFALGILDQIELAENKITLKSGDSLVVYTDGVTEAMNADQEMFGETKLKAYLMQHAHLSPKELILGLVSEVQSFVKSEHQSDDIAIFCIKNVS
jgi:phosphoserine phosphatase RsbU/P